MDMENLQREFAKPSNTYRVAPFWFLNHDMKDSELVWQIREMKRQGVGGLILHPRHGMITPYLSDEYMDRIETCIKEADKFRMKAYLYDENNWPSGPVDGELIEKYPEFRMSGCYLTQEWTVQGGKRLREKIDPKDDLIAVVAVPVGRNGKLEGLPQSAVPLMEYMEENELDWTAPKGGRWQVMVFTRTFLTKFGCANGYIDSLSKDAISKFIEMTHEKYADRFSGYFGGTVDGMFTDEPSMNYNSSIAAPWTPTLPAEFAKRHGYDIINALPAVFRDAGTSTAQIRCDFFDTATEAYAQAYFKQTYDWCEKRKLNFIGHVLYEGEMYNTAKHQGDFFRSARYMHFGGVDFLTDGTWPQVNNKGALNNLIGPKMASSAAHIYGKPRVMSEAFGVAKGWEIDLRTLKKLTDWQIALGINLFAPHAFYYSIQGQRKYECPPNEFYQSTFWPYYNIFADYVARLCSTLSGGAHVADIAVIYPTRSMWTAMNPDWGRTGEIIDNFTRVTMSLLQAGFDFDILPEETIIESMDPSDLEHMDSLEQYKAIIVPGCTTLLEDTAHFLSAAIEEGNSVIVCGDMPKTFVTAGASDWSDGFMTPELLADLFRLEYDWQSGKLAQRKSSVEDEELSAIIPDVAEKSVEDVTMAISNTLRNLIEPDVVISAEGSSQPYIPEIVHCHYRRGDIDFLFMVNTSDTENYKATISFNALGVPVLWDTVTGETKLIDDYEFEDERIKLTLDFQPTESHLISITPSEIWEPGKKPASSGKERVVQLKDEWEFSTLTPNALPIIDWHYKTDVEYGENWINGIHDYTAEFECDMELKNARLMIDGLLIEKIWRRSKPIRLKISLNDQPLENFEEGSYLDHLISETDVTGLLKKGKNVLRIRTYTWHLEAGNLSNPAYLIGDFELHGEPGSLKFTPETGKIKTGSWTEQGYPYYSGIGVYKQKVTLDNPKGCVLLKMEKPADMAEVIVNGKSAGVLPWEPWEVDITDFVKSGENEIEIRVANSLMNLLTFTPKPSGLVGKVEIVMK